MRRKKIGGLRQSRGSYCFNRSFTKNVCLFKRSCGHCVNATVSRVMDRSAAEVMEQTGQKGQARIGCQ